MSFGPTAFKDIALQGPRVRLRMLVPEDAPAIFGIFSNADVARYWSRPAMTTLSEAENLVAVIRAGYADGSVLQLGVERQADGTLLGTCTLFRLDWSNRRAELGYALGREHWGQGWMSEALEIVVRYAFVDLELRRLEADIDPRNLPSARSLQRLGFVQEGLLRERWFVNGEPSDTGFYGMLRREWVARRGAERPPTLETPV